MRRAHDASDRVNAIMQLWSDQRAQARWTEAQRATFSNLILLIGGVAIGFISQRGIRISSLFAAIPLIALGVFGSLVTVKYHERYEYHLARANHYLKLIADEFPQISTRLIGNDAIIEHRSRYPRLSRLRLYQLWVALHSGIAITGVALTLIIVLNVR